MPVINLFQVQSFIWTYRCSSMPFRAWEIALPYTHFFISNFINKHTIARMMVKNLIQSHVLHQLQDLPLLEDRVLIMSQWLQHSLTIVYLEQRFQHRLLIWLSLMLIVVRAILQSHLSYPEQLGYWLLSQPAEPFFQSIRFIVTTYCPCFKLPVS